MFKIEPFRHTDFLAILKWKQGERAALTTYRRGPSRLHVLFDMPPAGDFDHEKQRPLTPTEHIKMFGRRLRDAWGNRVAFVPEPTTTQIDMFADLDSPATVPAQQLEDESNGDKK